MDLKKLISESGLRFDFIAEKLFPKNRHPYNALNRVVTRGGELTGTQLAALADVTGLTVDALLGRSAAPWTAKVGEAGLIMRRGEVFVTAMPSAGMWEIWTAGGTARRISLDGGLTVREFIAAVESEINLIDSNT